MTRTTKNDELHVTYEYPEPQEGAGCADCQDGWVHIQHPCKPPGVIMHSVPCPKCNPKGESPDPTQATSWTYTILPQPDPDYAFASGNEEEYNSYIFEKIADIMSGPGFDRQERESLLVAFLIELAEKAYYGNLGVQDYVHDVEQDFRDVKDRMEKAELVVEEVQALRNRGYDGPFMGPDIELLLVRLHEWERAKETK